MDIGLPCCTGDPFSCSHPGNAHARHFRSFVVFFTVVWLCKEKGPNLRCHPQSNFLDVRTDTYAVKMSLSPFQKRIYRHVFTKKYEKSLIEVTENREGDVMFSIREFVAIKYLL